MLYEQEKCTYSILPLSSVFGGRRTLGRYSFFFFLGDKWGMPKTIVDPLINTKIIYLPKKKKTTRLPHLNIDSIHSFLLTVT